MVVPQDLRATALPQTSPSFSFTPHSPLVTVGLSDQTGEGAWGKDPEAVPRRQNASDEETRFCVSSKNHKKDRVEASVKGNCTYRELRRPDPAKSEEDRGDRGRVTARLWREGRSGGTRQSDQVALRPSAPFAS